jgi:hypothetical protein
MSKALELAKFGRETPPAGVVVGDTDAQTLSSKTFSDSPVFSGNGINGVPYLNASKVFTTAATFVFDGANLGIGTPTPGSKLHVSTNNEQAAIFENNAGQPALIRLKDTSSTTAPYIASYGNALAFGKYGGAETMRIDANGNVGIGVAPTVKFDVKDAITNGYTPSLRITRNSATLNDQFLAFYNGLAVDGQIGRLKNSDDLLFGFNSGTAFGEKMRLTTGGNLGIGNTNPGARLVVSGSGNIVRLGDGTNTFDVRFQGPNNWAQQLDTTNDVMNFQRNSISLVTFTSGGNVGIGNTNPSYKLQVGTAAATAASVLSALTPVLYVDGGSTANSSIVIKTHTGGSGTVHGAIRLAVSPDASNYSWSGMAGIADVNGAASTLAFYTASSNTQGTAAGASTERMRIDASGNVGINKITGLAAKLDVVGTTNISAKLTIGTFGDRVRNFEAYGSEALLDAGNGVFDLIIGDGGFAYMSLTTTDNATALKIRNYTGNADIATFERVSGNVGIGTTSLAGLKLVVKGVTGYPATSGTAQNGVFRVTGGTGLYNVLDMGVNESTDTAWIQATRANSLGTYDKLLINPYGGNVGIGTSSVPAYTLVVSAAGASGIEFGPAYSSTRNLIQNYSRSGATYVGLDTVASDHRWFIAGNPRMYLDTNGSLGIGEPNPVTAFAISGATAATLGIAITPSGWNSARHRFHVPVSGDNSVWSYNYNGSAVDFSGYATSSITVAQGNVYIATGNTNTAPSTVATFNSTGLGIGTAPSAKLDVVGNIYSSNKTTSPVNGQSIPGTLTFTGYGWNTLLGSRPITGTIGLSATYGDLINGSTEPALTFSLLGSGNNGYAAGAGPTTLTERMRINNLGNVGIGQILPLAKLHISTSNSTSFNAADNSWHSIIVNNQASASTHASGICFEVANLPYHSNAGTGIAAVKNGDSGDYGADLVFITRGQSIAASEKMRITATGNVGIGTTNPAEAKLEVKTASDGPFFIGRYSAGAAKLVYAYQSGSDGYLELRTGADQIVTKLSGYAGTASYFISSVGIGTQSPGAGHKLDVVGNIRSRDGGFIIAIDTAQYGGFYPYNRVTGAGSDYNPTVFSESSLYFAIGGSATKAMTLTPTGSLLIGTTSTVDTNGAVLVLNSSYPKTRLEIRNDGQVDGLYAITFRNGNGLVGNITPGGSSTAYNTSSDYRLKNTITPMTNALAKVALLKPVTYKWNVDGSNGEGFIAHELAEVCPQAVSGEKDALEADGSIKPQGIDTSFLVATLTAAIQEQQAMIILLKARLDAANL